MLKVSRRGLSIQILKAVPAPGTDLWRRLEKDGVLFPRHLLPWRFWDGNWACFMPKSMSLEEFQEIPMKIMKWFYNPFTFIGVCLKILVFPLDYFIRGWQEWKGSWRKDVLRWGGSYLVKKWKQKHGSDDLTKALGNWWREKTYGRLF